MFSRCDARISSVPVSVRMHTALVTTMAASHVDGIKMADFNGASSADVGEFFTLSGLRIIKK